MRKKKETIVTRKWGDRRKGKTDWARVDKLTDEDIAKAVAKDPDAVPVDIDWSDAVLVIPAKKRRSPSVSMKTCSTISKARAKVISAVSTRCCAPTCS
jgi:hypothetical protein